MLEKAQRLFKMLCEDYILMDDILFKSDMSRKTMENQHWCYVFQKVHTYNSVSTPYTFIGRTSMCHVNVSHG